MRAEMSETSNGDLQRPVTASHSLFYSFHAALFLDRSMPAVGRRRRQRQWTISSHWISLSILYRSSFSLHSIDSYTHTSMLPHHLVSHILC